MSELDDLLARFDEIDVSEYVEFFESRKIGDDVVVHSRFKADDLRRLCRAFAGGEVAERQGVKGSQVTVTGWVTANSDSRPYRPRLCRGLLARGKTTGLDEHLPG